MTTKKKIVLTGIFIVSLIASNLIGGFIGFNKGFEAGLFVEGLSVIPTISNLNNLHEGKTEWPIKHLETKLDWQIYNIDTYKNSNDSIYNIHKYDSDINSTELASTSMKHAIKYRRTHPSDFPDEEFQNTIINIMNKYDKAKSNDAHNKPLERDASYHYSKK